MLLVTMLEHTLAILHTTEISLVLLITLPRGRYHLRAVILNRHQCFVSVAMVKYRSDSGAICWAAMKTTQFVLVVSRSGIM